MCKKVLVVDDSKFNVAILKNILENEGYDVYSAYNARQALELILTLKPDAILLDVVMPEIDGFELCKIFKNNFRTRDIPIIMITSRTESIDVKKALELGAFDYIRKPIDEIEVIARIQSALRFSEYQNKLREMAMKDGLTGLYNHTLIIELFQKQLEKKKKNNENISFIMLDIDYFKKINDKFGHPFGDRVLREISNILLDTVSTVDIVGRYGGEEFSIISCESSYEDLFELCEKIRKNIENMDFVINDNIIKVTVSIGAFFKNSNMDINSTEMIKKADEALYSAKENGRNKVEILCV